MKDGALTDCGIPNAVLEFLEEGKNVLHTGTSSGQGKYSVFDDSTIDTPLSRIRYLRVSSERCEKEVYAFWLGNNNPFMVSPAIPCNINMAGISIFSVLRLRYLSSECVILFS